MFVKVFGSNNFNIFQLIGMTTAWLIVLAFVIYLYRKQQHKPKIWIVAPVIYIGMFSFSFSFMLNQQSFKLAILPLGVWFLLIVLPKQSKEKYRPYAWLGFCANYLFLFIMILSSFIHDGIYSKSNPTTFISYLDDAYLIPIHPSAQPAVLQKKRLQEQVEQLTPTDMQVIEWHRQSVVNTEVYYQRERFPYMLVGVKARWGSGLTSAIYIEDDGKGLLLTTPNQQSYYRVSEPLIERGVNDAD